MRESRFRTPKKTCECGVQFTMNECQCLQGGTLSAKRFSIDSCNRFRPELRERKLSYQCRIYWWLDDTGTRLSRLAILFGFGVLLQEHGRRIKRLAMPGAVDDFNEARWIGFGKQQRVKRGQEATRSSTSHSGVLDYSIRYNRQRFVCFQHCVCAMRNYKASTAEPVLFQVCRTPIIGLLLTSTRNLSSKVLLNGFCLAKRTLRRDSLLRSVGQDVLPLHDLL